MLVWGVVAGSAAVFLLMITLSRLPSLAGAGVAVVAALLVAGLVISRVTESFGYGWLYGEGIGLLLSLPIVARNRRRLEQ